VRALWKDKLLGVRDVAGTAKPQVKAPGQVGEAASTGGKPADTAQPALLSRIVAWFGGASKPAATAAPRERVAQPAPVIAPLDRMTVAQWLWGDGFVMPGNAEYVLELVKPFGLTPAMSMLDLSAGLGGPARAIAQAFGTYVTGLERSPERAKRGMEMSVKENLAKRATIGQYNPETVELRPNGFDCVLGRGATYNVVEKERLLRVLFQGLKQRGQLLFNEFVVDPTAGQRPELAAWAKRESLPPQLWTVEQYTDCMNGLGFDIRVVEDVTSTYASMIVAAWARMIEEVDLKSMARNHKLTVIDEAELWTYRLGALQSGALRVFRLYALANKPTR
jgi:cyclopropane fatty-acyl-phospholipid synthase-like methyltransferase